ncbi:MAG: 2-hydroxyacyl-CoA dehydratase family protein [Promethearchaeota archaeon]|jgi:benzoyl-CoA reductase/2-hydroxyglutaryl-CoA dehydratase subunit BcrC/BadD/HgdB
MNQKFDLSNRVIPLRMLHEALSMTDQLVKGIIPEMGIPALRLGVEKVGSVLKRNLEKASEGFPIVGYHFAIPAEYLACFDCVPVCLEGVGYYLATMLLNGVEKYYDLIGNWGHPFHTCTAQKGPMGMVLDDLFQFDALLVPTAPCDNTCASYPFFNLEKDIPLIIADMPFRNDENGYRYYAQQIKNSLIRLGDVIGQEPDFEKMKANIEIENKVHKLRLEIFELTKAIPSPISNIYNAVSAGTFIHISGTPENLSFYEQMLEITKNRYKTKQHHGGEEKIRSIWPYMVTYFDMSLCEWLDRELGMSVLFDIFNYNFSDPINTKSDLDTLFYDMARKAMGWPMVKQSTEFYYPLIDDCIRMARDFSADCFVFTQSLGCKQFGSFPQLLKEALMEELEIPMLLIEFDVGDKRFTPIKLIKEKIKMFSQTLM